MDRSTRMKMEQLIKRIFLVLIVVAVKIEESWWVQEIFPEVETIGLGDVTDKEEAFPWIALMFSDLNGLVDGGFFGPRRMVTIKIASVERRTASSEKQQHFREIMIAHLRLVNLNSCWLYFAQLSGFSLIMLFCLGSAKETTYSLAYLGWRRRMKTEVVSHFSNLHKLLIYGFLNK